MVEGSIPPELEGTLLRNGPGLFEVGGNKVRAVAAVGARRAGRARRARLSFAQPCPPVASRKPPSVCLPAFPPNTAAQVPQPFDGDGMLALFAFRGGRAFYSHRYVRTEGFLKEQARASWLAGSELR